MDGRKKNLDHFSICACHPCAGAMLIFSVSFQFYQMSPKRRRPPSAFGIYRPDYYFCKAYGLYAATSSLFLALFARSFSSAFLLHRFRTRFQRGSVGAFEHPVSLTRTPQNSGLHSFDLGVAEYLPRFLLSIDASLFCFLLASSLLRDDHFFPHLSDNYGGCRSTPCLPAFLRTVLPLGTHSRAPIDYLVEPSHFRNACCSGGRFFLGAHCFVFSLLRSTTVAHFSSARLVWSPPPMLSKIQLHLRSPILLPLTIFHHQTLLT